MTTKTRLFFVLTLSMLLISCSNPESAFKKAEQANTEEAYSEFVKRYPASPLAAIAKAKIESNAYEAARKNGTVAAYEGFLTRFPQSTNAQGATREIENIEFSQALASRSSARWESFLRKHTESTNAVVARRNLANLFLAQAIETNTIAAYRSVAERFPEEEAAKEARGRIEMLDYQVALDAGEIAAYEGFLAKYPASQQASAIKARIAAQLEERDWSDACLKNTGEAYTSFLAKHPSTRFRSTAIQNRFKVGMEIISGRMTLSLTAFRNSPHKDPPGVTTYVPGPGGFNVKLSSAGGDNVEARLTILRAGGQTDDHQPELDILGEDDADLKLPTIHDTIRNTYWIHLFAGITNRNLRFVITPRKGVTPTTVPFKVTDLPSRE